MGSSYLVLATARRYSGIMKTGLETQRAQYRIALERGLKEAVSRLSALPEVKRIILFGSYREGRRDLFTDLDLLVVLDSQKDPITRTVELYRRLGGAINVDLDLVSYTPDEIERNASNAFLKRALATGEVLYEAAR